MKTMKIGLDIHGVIDRYPEKFKYWSYNWVSNGNEIHIITGQQWEKVRDKIERLQISYTHHFSIVDHHLAKGTKMWQDDKKTWWMPEKIWLRSKGDYIRKAKVDVHFDDSFEYAEYMPDFCTFILVPKKNFILPEKGYR